MMDQNIGQFMKAMLGQSPDESTGPPYAHTVTPSDPWEGWQEGDPEPDLASYTLAPAEHPTPEPPPHAALDVTP